MKEQIEDFVPYGKDVPRHGGVPRSQGSDDAVIVTGPFAYQMRRADGVKILFSLLSSPSAVVNLVNGGSSSVQGMSNGEAARALVSLFSLHPVRTYSRNRSTTAATATAAAATTPSATVTFAATAATNSASVSAEEKQGKDGGNSGSLLRLFVTYS